LRLQDTSSKKNTGRSNLCHSLPVLIYAGVIKGRKITCWLGIRDDIIAAGALYEDREVVIDENLVSSRSPADLHAFGREMIQLVK
jgi:protease I